MRRFTSLVLSALVVALLGGCIVPDRTTGRTRQRTESRSSKYKKEKKKKKKKKEQSTPKHHTDANTGATPRM